MIHQPDPEKHPDMLEGLIAIRKLHTRAVEETGLICADEMLYPDNHRYLSDILGVCCGGRAPRPKTNSTASPPADWGCPSG